MLKVFVNFDYYYQQKKSQKNGCTLEEKNDTPDSVLVIKLLTPNS